MSSAMLAEADAYDHIARLRGVLAAGRPGAIVRESMQALPQVGEQMGRFARRMADVQARTGCTICGHVILADSEDWGPMCPDHYAETLRKLAPDAWNEAVAACIAVVSEYQDERWREVVRRIEKLHTLQPQDVAEPQEVAPLGAMTNDPDDRRVPAGSRSSAGRPGTESAVLRALIQRGRAHYDEAMRDRDVVDSHFFKTLLDDLEKCL